MPAGSQRSLGERDGIKSKVHQHRPSLHRQDLKTTVSFYTEKLHFTSAEHFDKREAFAAIYRDEIEIIVVKGRHGLVQENMARHGAGFDAYIDTETVDGVDVAYKECQECGVANLARPHMTDYGSYAFTFQDPDGRIIGVGRIADRNKFFAASSVKPSEP